MVSGADLGFSQGGFTGGSMLRQSSPDVENNGIFLVKNRHLWGQGGGGGGGAPCPPPPPPPPRSAPGFEKRRFSMSHLFPKFWNCRKSSEVVFFSKPFHGHQYFDIHVRTKRVKTGLVHIFCSIIIFLSLTVVFLPLTVNGYMTHIYELKRRPPAVV